MCGIAGILKHEQPITPDDLAATQRMLTAQIHRGPDGEGIVAVGQVQAELKAMLPARSQVHVPNVAASVILGHRRLAIIDLSDAARQPLANEGGTVWLTYNGEIYNYQTLRAELVRAGHRFTSHTDSEVIVHGYEEWGIEKLLTRLRGMFAFALYDARVDGAKGQAPAGRLVLARDRFGIKPLYYAHEADSIVFASEVRALLATGLFTRAVDPQALIRFLQLGSIPAPLTTVKEVRTVPAAHYAIADHAGIQLRPYWRLSDVLMRASQCAIAQSEDAAIHATRSRLDETVGLHLLSNVPLGTFLSGGIDSSSLVALASPHRTAPLTTLSVKLSESSYDESLLARLVAQQFCTLHHETAVTATDCFALLPQIVSAMDQPSADGVNTYVVARAAKQLGLTVALSGIGGDEVFLGYNHLKRAPLLGNALSMLQNLPTWARAAALATSAQAGAVLGKSGADRLRALAVPSPEHLYLLFRGLFPLRLIQELLGASDRELRTLPSLLPCAAQETRRSVDVTLTLHEFHLYLQSQLLRDADSMGMAHSLEIRVPFLDHHLVEYVLGLPLALRRRRRVNKPLLVRALGEALPRAVWDRPKQGFTLPFAQWLRQHGKDLEASTKEAQLFDQRVADTVWREFHTGRMHWSRPWALVVLSWLTAAHNRN
jgi:asparagine synthase (glutamine-hydrolysing)